MIDVEYRGCLRIEGVAMNRQLNFRFFDYDMDLSEAGVLKYIQKKMEDFEEM